MSETATKTVIVKRSIRRYLSVGAVLLGLVSIGFVIYSLLP